ncbi:MAG: helix-turn-helix domain-containing protein [Hadesarchaea archaeon]|nr:helix-turn-helix domain-containing protein [Hadesarchaea archaeon]
MRMQKARGPKTSEPSRVEELRKRLERIEKKLDFLLTGAERRRLPRKRAEGLEGIGGVLDVMTLLSLPDHLRKTALALIKLGRGTAEDVAKETGRARAIESAYLNQLVRMGYLKREREGKRVYFSALEASELEQKPATKEEAVT